MAKKNFTDVNTSPVYDTIAQATAEEQETQEIQEVQEKPKKRKARKTYTEQEKQDFKAQGITAGRKGAKLDRINMGFKPDVYDYITTMSRVRGETVTDFVNHILRRSMEENMELYQKAIEFRNSL